MSTEEDIVDRVKEITGGCGRWVGGWVGVRVCVWWGGGREVQRTTSMLRGALLWHPPSPCLPRVPATARAPVDAPQHLHLAWHELPMVHPTTQPLPPNPPKTLKTPTSQPSPNHPLPPVPRAAVGNPVPMGVQPGDFLDQRLGT